MAYALNPNDIVEVTFRGSLFQQVVLTILHYKYVGGAPIAAGATAMGALLSDLTGAAKLKDRLCACAGPEYNVDELRAQIIYPTRQAYFSLAVAFPGTNAGACTAPNVSAVILKTPDQAGHGRTGSLHIPGVPSGAYVDGAMTPAYLTTMSALGTEVAAQTYGFGVAGTAEAVIWSRVKPTTPSVITGARNNPYVRTMHRRTVGLGI